MKSIITWLSLASILLMLFTPVSISAAETGTDTVYMEDGSYLVITTTEFTSRTLGAKTVQRDMQYHDEKSDLKWTATLTASFLYDDITSECTYATLDVEIYDDAWYLVSENTRPALDTAISDFIMGKRYIGITTSTHSYTLTILCEPDGTVY